jgi:hypothetical protein
VHLTRVGISRHFSSSCCTELFGRYSAGFSTRWPGMEFSAIGKSCSGWELPACCLPYRYIAWLRASLSGWQKYFKPFSIAGPPQLKLRYPGVRLERIDPS